MEKVQQNNDPNWDSKQPKRNTTHNVLLKPMFKGYWLTVMIFCLDLILKVTQT